ncbi:MAG: hypothetical protein ACREU5_11840 [Burkholderiales bacterium]
MTAGPSFSLCNNEKQRGIGLAADATVKQAAERYLKWFRQHKKSVRETEHVINAHILPALGDLKLEAVTAPKLRAWLDALASQPARVRSSRQKPKYRASPRTADEKRARRSTANRILNVLKALLNRAFQDGLAADDTAWRKVKPFAKADEARIRFLSDAEAVRLVNACPADLRALVRAALLTGARYGELARLRHEALLDDRAFLSDSDVTRRASRAGQGIHPPGAETREGHWACLRVAPRSR